MMSLQQLDMAHNKVSDEIPDRICDLSHLKNFTYSYNYFFKEPARCLSIRSHDDRQNCFPLRPLQCPPVQCTTFLSKPNSCDSNDCIARPPPWSPPASVHP
ncbi:hypothetical protein ZIOFF_038069 [Zingiber officinale]|uniref:Uncharacterized protein n=1 Tax=Zingiber officinale TaxID=94328 RepID=A0A8J5L4Q9_ZINOF|nr:hypothetical protein ZIOFF_038069 [Zingiber officinale]